MFDWLEYVLNKIKEMNVSIDEYKKDTIIQSLPSFAYVNRAKKLIDSNHLLEAEMILNSALSLPQEDALVYKYLAVIAEKTGRKTDAIASYKKSAEINPNDKDIWRCLGFAMLSAGFAQEAEPVFENANKVNPMNTDVFTGWGMTLLKQKKYIESLEKFTTAIQLSKYNFMALFLSAVVEMKLERFDEAETKLKFLASVNPNESNTYEFAHLKYLKGDMESAVHYAKKALTFNAQMLPAYILLGELYCKLKDETNSLAAYKEAERMGLINENLYTEWALALQFFGKYDEAKEKFEKALEIDSQREDAKAGLAICAAFCGDTETAENILDGLGENIQKTYPALKARAFIAYKNNDFSKSADLFKEVLKNNQYDCRLLYYIAKSFEALDNKILAKEYYEKAINENTDCITFYIDYANFLIKQNEFADCQRKLRRALKIDENNLDVLNLYFYVSYILVKENICEYNVKETLVIAGKILAINSEAFKYRTEMDELSGILSQL